MNVVIVGAGSIGLLLGSFLAEAGMTVNFCVGREVQAQLIRDKGIQRINQDGMEDLFDVGATTDIGTLAPTALWIVAVKYAGLRELLPAVRLAAVENPVLFIQNGIGHMELVNNAALPHVAFATVEHGARRVDDRTVNHNGVGMLTVGDKRVFDILEQACSLRFPVSYDKDAEQILMRKVLINCMINPLTAILKVKNGELLTNAHCRALFDTLFDELMVAFPEMQSVLPYEAVVGVCENTASNQSSMLADCLAGRPMEIETIVSAVIRKANDRQRPLRLLTMLETMLYAINGKGGGV